MFLDVLKQTAIEKCGLSQEEPVLLGVSGGADSLALMHGLDVLGFNLVIAHLDHGLRPESAQDADFVQQLAGSRNLPFIRQTVDVKKAAQVQGESIEEAARHVRYQFLFEQARDYNAQAVMVAHHADDQIETVLMHFIRGAALSGLSGMSYRRVIPLWDHNIPLVRPLLSIWRVEIEAYLESVGLEPRVDSSNKDTTFFRNRLRHELIPILESYNSQIRQVVWRMSDVLREEDGFLDKLAEAAWEKCFISATSEQIQLVHTEFVLLPKALQRRVLRYAISLLRPDLRDVGFFAIERGLDFASETPDSGEIDLVARLNLTVIRDLLIVKTWEAELPDWGKPLLPSETFRATLDLDHPVELRHNWQIVADRIEASDDILKTFGKMDIDEAWLDFDLLEFPLIVRGRKPGERWHPLGMGDHTQSLQDFFINEKVPAHLRDIWPLVCSGDQIAWLAGLRPSELFKITEHTQNILHLRIVQQQD